MSDAAPDPLDDLVIGYVLPTEEEIADLWSRAIVAVDASVLLNVYRYSPEARDNLLTALASVRDRLFVPHQAALEYFRNRLPVLTTQRAAKDQMAKAIDEAIESLLDALVATHREIGRREPVDEITAEIRKKLQQIRDELLAAETERLPRGDHRADEMHTRLIDIIRGAVGPEYEAERFDAIIREGSKRYADEVPPGYLDKDKDGLKRYGDLLVWNQILDRAAEVERPVIYVSDDVKDDWLWRVKGKTVGPRPELTRELHARAGVELLIYQTPRFLTFAAEEEHAPVSAEVIAEAEAHAGDRLAQGQGTRWQKAARTLAQALADGQSGFVAAVQVMPDGGGPPVVLQANTWLQGGGRLSCVIRAPSGTQSVWSGRLEYGSFVVLGYPREFILMAPEGDCPELEAGRHTVRWRFVPDDPEHAEGEMLDAFMIQS